MKRGFEETPEEEEAFPAADGGRWRPAMLFARDSQLREAKERRRSRSLPAMSRCRDRDSPFEKDMCPFFSSSGGHRLSADDLIGGPVGLGNQGHVGDTNGV